MNRHAALLNWSIKPSSVVAVLLACTGCHSGAPHQERSAGWTRGTALLQQPSLPTDPVPPPAAAGPVAAPGLREVFPHVRVNVAERLVEFDATTSPMLVEDPQAPLLFLEVIACTPDTREHETLVVTKARPSHVHAAMLLIGLVPGEPGHWKLENDRLVPIDPTGARVAIEFEWTDPRGGAVRRAAPTDWIASGRDKSRLGDDRGATGSRPRAGWVFSGSRIVKTSIGPDGAPLPAPRDIYEADGAGALIGLASFGGETIAWSRTFSPDAGVDEPEWIADFAPAAAVHAPPPPNTPVTVRIRPE
jgi:hypothetical protein